MQATTVNTAASMITDALPWSNDGFVTIFSNGPVASFNENSLEQLNVYKQEIRLLRILPPTHDGDVRGHIGVYSRDKAPPYVALSYTWGRPGSEVIMMIDEKPIWIRKNLHRSLRQIQCNRQFSGSLFWIDALCINQHDTTERTHQVNMMAEIYKAAEAVVIWLGPAYQQSELAMTFLRFCSSSRMERSASKLWRKPVAVSLRSICQRDYWSRLWVVQEVALSREQYLMCGQQVVRYHNLKTFLDFCESATSSLSNHGLQLFERSAVVNSPVSRLIRHIDEAAKHATLIDQMRASQHLYCSDPRDKVYALRSLLPPSERDIRPDYALQLPELANCVLQSYYEHELPDTPQRLLGQCKEVASLLGIDTRQLLQGPSLDEEEFSPHANSLLVNPWGFSFWWMHRYGHHRIEHILAPLWVGRAAYLEDACTSTTFGLYHESGYFRGTGSLYDLALLQAIWDGRLSTVKVLLRPRRADIQLHFWTQRAEDIWSNYRHPPFCSMTPLALAVQAGRSDVVDVLLQAGADVTASLCVRIEPPYYYPSLHERLAFEGREISILSLAACTSNIPIVSLLLSKSEAASHELRADMERTLIDIFGVNLRSTEDGRTISAMLAAVMDASDGDGGSCFIQAGIVDGSLSMAKDDSKNEHFGTRWSPAEQEFAPSQPQHKDASRKPTPPWVSDGDSSVNTSIKPVWVYDPRKQDPVSSADQHRPNAHGHPPTRRKVAQQGALTSTWGLPPIEPSAEKARHEPSSDAQLARDEDDYLSPEEEWTMFVLDE